MSAFPCLYNNDYLLILIKLFIYCRGVRPFGVSLLVAGWDEDEQKPYLYQCDPSVSF